IAEPEIVYAVRTSPRARNIRVTVDPVRGVEVVVPASVERRGGESARARAAAAAVAELRPWIERRQAEVGRLRAVVEARGGSVPRSGAMSFNWRLLLAPEPVLQYVVWHEVCHLEVLDHSPRFWSLLASRSPGYREHAAWLRRYGATLVLA